MSQAGHEGAAINGAQFLVRALEAEGVEVVFGYPGGAIMPVYDALVDAKFKHILTRHEQGAALAADGYARANGRVGVCLATSGPGATNLVTGIANAYLDSVPMVAITGQVATPVMGTDAFQEVDIFGMTMPVVKHSFLVRRIEALPDALAEAFQIARSGRPGPVLLDLPKDVALAAANHLTYCPLPCGEAPSPDDEQVARACELLQAAQRPVLYAGGGIGIAGAQSPFRRFTEQTGIPTVTTLKGIGALPADHPELLGMLGMHGTQAANHSVHDCDVLVCVGARFDDRATGKLETFAAGAKVVHLDIDPAEVGKLRAPQVSLVADLNLSLAALADALQPTPLAIEPWRARCFALRQQHAWRYDAPGSKVYAPAFLRDLTAQQDTIICSDVGQHQMWVAQHGRFADPAQHLSSGGLGTMGYGLPAAIGAQLAQPDARVVVVSGDGSIMMNIQELATLRRYGLPVKIVVLDNQHLGMVRQWQELFFEERYSETSLWDNPDFAQVAQAFGIPAIRVETREQAQQALERLRNDSGALFVHVCIDKAANVWPLVPPGKSNAVMLESKEQAHA